MFRLFLHLGLAAYGYSAFGQMLQHPIQSGSQIQKNDIVINVTEVADIPTIIPGRYPELNIIKPAYDGSNRLFVNDLNGQLWVLSESYDHTSYMAFSDTIGERFYIEGGYQSGLTSFAFHPEFSKNGKFYTVHSEWLPGDAEDPTITQAPEGYIPADFTFEKPVEDGNIFHVKQTVITEWTTDDPAANEFANPESRRELMRIDQGARAHSVQEIGFNPYSRQGIDEDYGLLYICQGDNRMKSSGYHEQTGVLHKIFGAVLRIDPTPGNSSNGQYTIPDSNPYALDGDENTLGEIYATGFRNAHRISWDPEVPGGGNPIVSDIGEKNIEEINVLVPGAHYGWPHREGRYLFDPTTDPAADTLFVAPLPENDEELGYTYPALRFDHDLGRSVIGGYVYRGSENDDIYGQYVFGYLRFGNIYTAPIDAVRKAADEGGFATFSEASLTFDGIPTTMQALTGTTSRLAMRFGIDEAQNLYITSWRNGKIYKVQALGEQRMLNLSSRGYVQGTSKKLVGGFVVGEGPSQRYLIRAVGPELAFQGISDSLPTPKLDLYNQSRQLIATNDDWVSSSAIANASEQVGAFPLFDNGSSSAILLELEPGPYTANISGADGDSGIALVEVYEVDDSPSVQRLLNLSTRATVNSGQQVLVGGFVIQEGQSKRYLIRAVGPELANYNISNSLPDPMIVIRKDGDNTFSITNDDVGDNDEAAFSEIGIQVGAFPLNNGSKSSAVIATLQPGIYTVIVSDSMGSSGQALVEIYEIPDGSSAR